MKAVNPIEQTIMVLCILSACISCNHSSQKRSQPTFIDLECSYDYGWGDDIFSMKIDSTGRLLLSKNRWKPYQYYQGRLSQKDLNTLFLKVKDTQLNELKAHYKADFVADKHYYNIWVTTLTHRLQKVQVYGDSVPAKLESLRRSIRLIQDTISIKPVSHKTVFATRSALYPTSPSIIKFVPPLE